MVTNHRNAKISEETQDFEDKIICHGWTTIDEPRDLIDMSLATWPAGGCYLFDTFQHSIVYHNSSISSSSEGAVHALTRGL